MAITIDQPYSQGTGYALIIGLGALFAIGMSLLSLVLKRYFAQFQTSEMFMTADHSVKTGLTASAVVSSWTISSTLLTSTSFAYSIGVSGPYWYGAGAAVQILLFSVVAIELKRKAPNAHTFLEVARKRYGSSAHIVLGSYSVVIQVLGAVNLLVGGSAVYASLTGINRDAACYLFTLGVMTYTLFGGIKATFMTDWVHTVIIYVIMMTALFVVYSTSSVIGSPGKMWELLQEAAERHPVAGNAEGSYLTMRSEDGGYIGLVLLGAGFAGITDSQLWQKAIAANPANTLGGYLLGGSCWFTIPFVLATTFGLTAVATEVLPVFPTYPNPMTAQEINDGMAMPYAAMAVMGKGGGIGVLLMIFMAITSAMSSETIAHAALITYDVYQAYIHPNASGNRLARVSQGVVVAFSLVIPAIAIGFNHAGFSVSFLVTACGIFVDSAVIPMFATILWKKQSKLAVCVVPPVSSVLGITAWLTLTHRLHGVVTMATTQTFLPLAAGNMVSLCAPLFLTPLVTFLKPQDFDWEILKTIRKADDADVGQATVAIEEDVHFNEDAKLLRARKFAAIASIVLTLIYLVLWPIPMYGTRYVFSRNFFTGWMVIVFLWAFYATIVITMLPIWESRRSIVKFCKYFITGRATIVGATSAGSVPSFGAVSSSSDNGKAAEVVGAVENSRSTMDFVEQKG